ncbi:hypothetical protein [Streptomyces sp. NBC_01190]|uniref:hypothetical protein n=1 Tax=Streptomyces sp. NBC_01190 TaxID=2903767 RepID=UPI00386DA496|nr:hypothetical protein OG519_20415 [Streptomyces sp. NBC_01190]
MRRARTAAVLTGLAAVLTLSACGVPPSGVIQAGDPATGLTPAISLYFTSGGKLLAISRPVEADVTTAVALLFEGPDPMEASKIGTALPWVKVPPVVVDAGPALVLVRLHDGVPRISPLGMSQLVCTVAGVLRQNPDPAPPANNRPTSVPLRDSPASTPTGKTTPASPGSPLALPRPTARQHVTVRVTAPGWSATQGDESCPTG